MTASIDPVTLIVYLASVVGATVAVLIFFDRRMDAKVKAADALAARSRKTFVGPWDIAFLYVHAGDKGRALEWLEKAVEGRDPNAPYIGLPDFDSLRSESRFQALLRKMNLPQ